MKFCCCFCAEGSSPGRSIGWISRFFGQTQSVTVGICLFFPIYCLFSLLICSFCSFLKFSFFLFFFFFIFSFAISLHFSFFFKTLIASCGWFDLSTVFTDWKCGEIVGRVLGEKRKVSFDCVDLGEAEGKTFGCGGGARKCDDEALAEHILRFVINYKLRVGFRCL